MLLLVDVASTEYIEQEWTSGEGGGRGERGAELWSQVMSLDPPGNMIRLA